jgi:urease accessory protein
MAQASPQLRRFNFLLYPCLVGVLVLLGAPGWAHHPLAMSEELTMSPLSGLISGIGHPLLGTDHALFLISIAFIGISRLRKWAIPLLVTGLVGSAIAQFATQNGMPFGTEFIIALSLSISGLVALQMLPPVILVPMMFTHGLALGSEVVGSEPTPLLFYFVGLFISQTLLLLISCQLAKSFVPGLSKKLLDSLSFCWIALGISLASASFGLS